MNKYVWKCGVEPCPKCNTTPIAIDTDTGFTIGCGDSNCDNYFIVQDITLERTLLIWNRQAELKKLHDNVKQGK